MKTPESHVQVHLEDSPEDSHLSIRFYNGSLCDLTKKPRETVIKIFCPPKDKMKPNSESEEMPHHIASVLEPGSCLYTMNFYSTHLCQLSAFKKKEESVGKMINCYQLDGKDISPNPRFKKVKPATKVVEVMTDGKQKAVGDDLLNFNSIGDLLGQSGEQLKRLQQIAEKYQRPDIKNVDVSDLVKILNDFVSDGSKKGSKDAKRGTKEELNVKKETKVYTVDGLNDIMNQLGTGEGIESIDLSDPEKRKLIFSQLKKIPGQELEEFDKSDLVEELTQKPGKIKIISIDLVKKVEKKSDADKTGISTPDERKSTSDYQGLAEAIREITKKSEITPNKESKTGVKDETPIQQEGDKKKDSNNK